MNARASPGGWEAVLERMLRELRSNEPRADAYWAQQLALGPVLFHALSLRLRTDGPSEADAPHLTRVLQLAAAVLGPLPEVGNDPTALAILARRQAAALTTGRRRQIARLAARHGLASGAHVPEAVPPRLVRPYPLLGWLPPDAGT